MSKRFSTIQIKDIQKTTSDCSVITFDIPELLHDQFAFRQGQYLTLKADIDGVEVRRSYSLCSSPIENEWSVGIKKIPQGLFSSYANDVLQVGDTLEAMPPMGSFNIDIDADAEQTIALFAAGSGITPILSIIKTHLNLEPNTKIKLFYGSKTVASIILKEELEALKNQFMNRFEIFYFLSKEFRSTELFNGRINRQKLDEIQSTGLCDFTKVDHFFSCGPEEMIMMVKSFLEHKGVSPDRIHFELFTSSTPIKKRIEIDLSDKENLCDVVLHEGGKQFLFEMPKGSEYVLDAALRNNADLPYACKGGVCSTCKAKVIKGKTEMDRCFGLEDDEIKEGYILTCQAKAMSKDLVVDFDV